MPATAQAEASLRTLNGYFPWTAPVTPGAWEARATALRQQILVSQGLWPLPSRTDLRAVVHGRVEREDFTVDRVFCESMPGLFVTGSLYRPRASTGAAGPDGRRAAVLAPHGHFEGGRFQFEDAAEGQAALAAGAEAFETAARRPLQARCVQLVRMGCVVFHYDMLGYADSQQFAHDRIHGELVPPPLPTGEKALAFYSAAAEGWNLNPMGLQTWNSIRALDFITSLPDVDPARIGVTGASGGGTQAMLLAALDDRIAAAVPAVMVSTAMQGGCTCENASALRIGTGNVEFAALFAPRPMALTTADDWTIEMPRKGFPQLADHWARLGSPDKIKLFHHPEFKHNFNGTSCAGMYAWFNKHLALHLPPAALVERDFMPLTQPELTVWTAEHPAPTATGPAFEAQLLTAWRDDAQRQLADQPGLLLTGWETAVGRTLATTGTEFSLEVSAVVRRGNYSEQTALLTNLRHQEEISLTILLPDGAVTETVIWLEGMAAADPAAAIAADLAGCRLVLPHLRHPQQNRNTMVPTKSAAPVYTYGYNHSLLALRVHDLLSLMQFLRPTPGSSYQSLALHATGPAVPAATLAAALTTGAGVRYQLAPSDFRFAQIHDPTDPNFLPGSLRFGDIPALRQLAGLPP